ncbi:uncharacterized protein PODANS_2_14030 [Podospora anserina S mat+]|uniref:Podospora anserina S mat+ genomic DNA chromosome 2, supercontig 3 n=1 Tax=Podospora anserina (strain S / ATCC MYA-4624 / DSM 980 / FGSC 10383) TaxID=515849 RepID=B2AC25_PODAN|nr:uncharacterized protein PODANS_2_14030 [Podospora anserina S mat+]CAP61005.1 unnamed protein product [Podospora anserina S mat+]CDP26422.1 Putative protein of unknown function [Podospora anserina S mat+]
MPTMFSSRLLTSSTDPVPKQPPRSSLSSVEYGQPFFAARSKRKHQSTARMLGGGKTLAPPSGTRLRDRLSASFSSSPFSSPPPSVQITPSSTPLAGTSGSPSSNGANPQEEDAILFPKVYQDAWGAEDVSRSDIDRARIFLLRIVSMSGDTTAIDKLRAILADPSYNRTVPALAYAVQTLLYRNRHASFTVTPLLQAVRYMLLKARVPENPYADRARAVLDFFFDPALQRNLSPLPPGELIRMLYPSGRLKVCIIGGGPTGLASAISLAERGRGKVEVHVWERRWIITPEGKVDYPATAKRRDQVVTLQDTVTNLLSPRSYEALFAGRPERVWPGSANIQIRKVEDRFLKHCQTEEFSGLIHLHAEGVTREELAAGKCGDFHVLLGTDGAASWVRKSYFDGYETERGKSYALGLAFDRGARNGLPWSQPLNMFLTLGQTRYLLNASDYDGRGYLNMQLTEEEWHKMVSVDGQPIHFGRPACLRRLDGSIPEGFDEGRVFAPSEDRNSPLWKAVEDGLKLFGFKESEVINVVRIPIVVQAVREGVHMLPLSDSSSVTRPHALVAVAGDAAMTVHFWPGRGLNSGIKAGIALGDEICHALRGGKFAGLELKAMKEYNDFIMKLQNREHDKRSIPILNLSGSPEMLGWLLDKARSVPDEVAIEWLVGAMVQIASRLEQRRDWHFPPEANIEPQIRIVLRQLHSQTLREMAVSFPWPTREMTGAEVLPIRSTKPMEKVAWLESVWKLLDRDSRKKDASRGASPGPANLYENMRMNAQRSKSPMRGRDLSPQRSLSPPGEMGNMAAQMEGLSMNGGLGITNSSGNVQRSAGTLSRRSAVKERVLPSPVSSVSSNDRWRHPNLSQNLDVPCMGGNGDRYQSPARRSRSPGPIAVSPVSPDPAINLTRMLSVKRPPGSMFSDAMALALFRVDDDGRIQDVAAR